MSADRSGEAAEGCLGQLTDGRRTIIIIIIVTFQRYRSQDIKVIRSGGSSVMMARGGARLGDASGSTSAVECRLTVVLSVSHCVVCMSGVPEGKRENAQCGHVAAFSLPLSLPVSIFVPLLGATSARLV